MGFWAWVEEPSGGGGSGCGCLVIFFIGIYSFVALLKHFNWDFKEAICFLFWVGLICLAGFFAILFLISKEYKASLFFLCVGLLIWFLDVQGILWILHAVLKVFWVVLTAVVKLMQFILIPIAYVIGYIFRLLIGIKRMLGLV